jgi:RNA polymerase sigma factor (sigma-70 family)
MGHSKNLGPIDALFAMAYPLIQRAARARSTRFLDALRAFALDPSDLEQEIALAVLTALLDFDASRSSLATYVDRVAEFKTRSILRKTSTKKRRRKDLSSPRPDPQLFLAAIERRLDLEDVLKKLRKSDQTVARILADCTPAEAARILQVSRQMIYRRIDRIRDKFLETGFR